ncbi:MAG: Rieske 2Fe-2S domain-containing protein, partial [candidate division NC10 bacterium]
MGKPAKIAEKSDLNPGECKVVEVEGKTLAIFNVGGSFYAVDNTCLHRGGPLGEGE